ncbi:MAG: ribulose-phosphate 3-epimerase [Bacilli bacterium]|nr:ribulose-phosphate 3-epimerase [Bacilli bacterium]
MIKIATSILSATDRVDSIKRLNNTSTDYVHIDVMDGLFVPNYQLPVKEVNELGKLSNKLFDIHLMMEEPEAFIEHLSINNIDTITFHIEIDPEQNISDLINMIRKKGYKTGLAIKPNTDMDLLDKYLDIIDKVIIMSVEPGFGGQKFIENTVNRINTLRKKRPDIIIEVDGGINDETIGKVKDIIDIAVVGSYITNSNNYEKTINELKN